MENKENESVPKLTELLTTEKTANSNNINQITDKIYLGCEEGLNEYDFFKTENIHNIISITSEIHTFPEEMNIKTLNLTDENCLATKFLTFLKKCIEFIENSDKVFIHCSCGVDRSPTITIGYLMWKTHSGYDEVYNYVKEKRHCVEPNSLSVIRLKKLDKALKQNNYHLEKIDMK